MGVGELLVVRVVCAKALACDTNSTTRQDNTHSLTSRIFFLFKDFLQGGACLGILHQVMSRHANGALRLCQLVMYDPLASMTTGQRTAIRFFQSMRSSRGFIRNATDSSEAVSRGENP